MLFHRLNTDIEFQRIFLSERRYYDLMIVAATECLGQGVVDAEYRKLQRQIRQGDEWKKQQRYRRYFKSLMQYVAVLLLAVGILSYLFFFEKTKAVQYSTITVPKGSKVSVYLPDSSKVWLNAGSTLRYPASFDGKSREVWLDGEAYFEVDANPKRQFFVHTSELDVVVTGTSFNMHAYSEDCSVETTLLSGVATVCKANDGTKLTSLVPNRRIIYNKKSTAFELQTTDAHLSASWIKGEFHFKNERLERIALKLERYYDLKIIIQDTSIKECRFTGTFLLSEPYSKILKVIELYTKATCCVQGNQVTIKKKQ